MKASRPDKIAPPNEDRNGEQLLTRRQAAGYLAVSSRWLEGRSDIPVVDIASPKSRKAMPRYRQSDLDRCFAANGDLNRTGRR